MNLENVEVLPVEIPKVNTKEEKIVLKRTMDIFFAIIGIICLIPIIAVVAIIHIIKREHSSIFFVQERIGKDGKLFKMYKFQTMIKDADKELEIYLKKNKKAREEYKKNKKLTDDPRITKTGRILRKTSLDEFPQFINILKGEMSLVGPRPYLPREIDDMGGYYEYITRCKPGLTGPWQTAGRSHISFADRLEIDYDYSNEKSFRNDVSIIKDTIKITLKGIGAV
jgi:undecaprenyl-phosphate galactose phosphotransferase